MDMSDSAYLRAEELLNYAVIPLTLNAVVKLGVMDVLSHSPLSAVEIVSATPGAKSSANATFLDRALRLLASYGIVTEEKTLQGERKYGLTEVGKFFSTASEGSFTHALATICNYRIFLKPFEHLPEAILEGGHPFGRAHGGKTQYELAAEEPDYATNFNLCMASHSKGSTSVFLERYGKFSDIHTLIDVGGGQGTLLGAITSRYPHIRGINFDQPHVIAGAFQFSGVEHIGGDMFESIPQGDTIILKWILHNWDDEKCVKILKNCFKSLPEEGKVIVIEASDVHHSNFLILDILMMVDLDGKERTLEEYKTLGQYAGFKAVEIATLCKGLAVMEFHKQQGK